MVIVYDSGMVMYASLCNDVICDRGYEKGVIFLLYRKIRHLSATQQR